MLWISAVVIPRTSPPQDCIEAPRDLRCGRRLQGPALTQPTPEARGGESLPISWCNHHIERRVLPYV